MESRDRQRLMHIIEYCDKIDASCARYGNSLEVLTSDVDFQQSVAFSLVQIGELVAGLSEELKVKYDSVPWRGIKSMRNIVVHGYGSISLPVVWSTLSSDIPELREKCIEIISDDETCPEGNSPTMDTATPDNINQRRIPFEVVAPPEVPNELTRRAMVEAEAKELGLLPDDVASFTDAQSALTSLDAE